MSRKDLKGMFAAVLGQLESEDAAENEPLGARFSSPHLLTVAAGVRQMQERSNLADKLLKDGEQIVELDPDKILPSSIPDRFDSAYDAEAIAEIVDLMRERGQIVPGLVRPVADGGTSFQIVYGRRRLAAAKILGVKFRATIRRLTDEQAVIFQGEENAAREDLSYIEKCSFAFAQEQAGYRRETICASLATGKSHISEMIKIGSSIPAEILHAVGKAPGIGRGRWEELSRLYAYIGSVEIAADLVKNGKFNKASSDDRFNLLINALQMLTASTSDNRPRAASIKEWLPSDQLVSARLKDNGTTATLALGAPDGPRFAAFITEQLDKLYEAFRVQETERSRRSKTAKEKGPRTASRGSLSHL